jgi:serine/threonine protein kinase
VALDCANCGAANADSTSVCTECGAALVQAPEVRPGFVLAGRYELQKALGRGGMGLVYKAHDRLLNETVAIKLLRPEIAATADAARRFISEIKLARSISHRNVGRIHEYGEDRGLRYISMAYVDGIDLKKLIRDRGALPPAEAYEIAISVGEALEAIHHEGIVHRDLKAPNVMIDGRGVARLMDFGIAKHWAADTDGVTGTGQIIGTPEYMSPEQIRGETLDARSDLYALGILVHELFTGRTPFHAETPVAIVMKHLTEPPALDGPAASSLPSALVPVLRTALSKERESRFATAREFVQALEKARNNPHTGPTFVPAPPPTGEVPPPTTLLSRDPPTPDAPTVVHRIEARPSRPLAATVEAAPGPPASRRGLAVALAGMTILVLAVALLSLQRPVTDTTNRQTAAEVPAVPSPAASAPPATLPPSAAPATVVADSAASALRPGPAVPLPQRRLPPTLDAGKPKVASTLSPASSAVPAPKPLEATPDRSAETERLVADAEQALTTQDYAAAIALYDQAIKLDPLNQGARMGRATAVNAKVTAQALGPGRQTAGLNFVVGTTQTRSPESRPDVAFAEGFKTEPGVEVTRDTTAAVVPGRIEFQMKPEQLNAGDRYELSAFLFNSGAQAIELKEMVVTTIINGKKVSGPVSLLTRIAAPGQRSLLLQVRGESLPDNLKDWSVEVFVRSTRGDTHSNRIALK